MRPAHDDQVDALSFTFSFGRPTRWQRLVRWLAQLARRIGLGVNRGWV